MDTLAIGSWFRLLRPITDFHRLVSAHAGRTYENRQARKARSRRLIQKGALLEKYFQANNLSVEQTEELLKTFADYVNAHKPDKLKKRST
ncbi:Hypothetical protein ADU71_0074 (plasmid) [Pediococcus damnosus]|nr:Hypothetical protein ADU69_0041 [Pediococcus damnosus]AMV66049.1 Hypothetical protein ADU71_0074 [Pediococcus damnosus]